MYNKLVVIMIGLYLMLGIINSEQLVFNMANPPVPVCHQRCDHNRISIGTASIDHNLHEYALRNVFKSLRNSSMMARNSAMKYKAQFQEFESTVNNMENLKLNTEFDWLPIVSIDLDLTNFDPTLLKNIHQYIETFAIVFEELLSIHPKGLPQEDIRDIVYNCCSILCDNKVAMIVSNQHGQIRTNTRHRMIPFRYRHIANVSTHRLRDYLILRQYLKTIDFVLSLVDTKLSQFNT